jgi:hypothetical protein
MEILPHHPCLESQGRQQTALLLMMVALATSALAVHWSQAAGTGAHSAVKSFATVALLVPAAALVRALRVPKVVALYGGIHLLAAAVGILRGCAPTETAAALAAPLLLVLGCALAAGPHGQRRLQTTIAVLASMAALLALIEIHGFDLPWAHDRRPQSAFGNRNFLAHYLAMALPSIVTLETKTRRSLILRSVAISLCVTVLAQTRCRSAWIALGVAFTCVVCAQGLPKNWREHGFTVVAAGLGLLLSFAPNRLAFHGSILDSASRVAEIASGSGAGRIAQWGVAGALFVRAPLSGTGLGSWLHAVHGRPDLRAIIPGPVGTTPNSDLARGLVEGGAPLVGIMLALLVWSVLPLGRAPPRSESTASSLHAATATAIVAAVLAWGDTPLFRPETSLLLGLALGWRTSAAEADVSLPQPLVFAVGLVACAASLRVAIPA